MEDSLELPLTQLLPSENPAMKKAKNTCLEYGCIKCCLNTEMPLTRADILRIVDLGFSESHFIVKKSGSRRLKNLSGRCVFHNGRRCIIYSSRPDGCRLYPVIFCESTGMAVLDSYCPHNGEFQVHPGISRKLVRLVRKLDAEKEERTLRSGAR